MYVLIVRCYCYYYYHHHCYFLIIMFQYMYCNSINVVYYFKHYCLHAVSLPPASDLGRNTRAANLRTSTNIVDFRGFDSSGILILRGGIVLSTGSGSIGDFPESLSQQILVGIILVGRLGVGLFSSQRALTRILCGKF